MDTLNSCVSHKKSENGAPWGIFIKTRTCFDFEPPSQDRESRMLDRATPTGLAFKEVISYKMLFRHMFDIEYC